MPDAGRRMFAVRSSSSTSPHDNRSYPLSRETAMTLPTPDPAFDWTAEAWGHALRAKSLSTLAQHAFTSKQLQLRGGPQAQPASWAAAAASVGGDLNHVMRVRQVHGAVVRVLKKGRTAAAELAETPEADAIVSNARGPCAIRAGRGLRADTRRRCQRRIGSGDSCRVARHLRGHRARGY